MPLVIASWFRLTRAPRTRGGTTSPMSSGTTMEADPTARPMTTRAASSTG